MYVRREIRARLIWKFAWRNVPRITLWACFVTAVYAFAGPRGVDISIPFVPLATIGTAVAFYIGFENSQSYDRL